MACRVLCLFFTSEKKADEKIDGEKEKDKQKKKEKEYSFCVRFREDKPKGEIEALGFVTNCLHAIGVEHLNVSCIEKALGAQLSKGGYDVIGFTNIHSTKLNDRFECTTVIVAIQVPDPIFRERLPNSSQFIWLPWDEATKWYFDKKFPNLVYQAMKSVIDYKILPLRSVDQEVVTMEGLHKEFYGTLSENHKQLLSAAGFSQPQVYRIHELFVESVFPDSVMTFAQFSAFFYNHEMRSGEDVKALHRAMNMSKERGVTFHDFLMGLAAVQPTTPHGRSTGDYRARLIFRYFCSGCDEKSGALKREELEAMFAETEKRSRRNPNSRQDIEEIVNMPPLTLTRFLKLAGSLKLRGGSCLLRMKKSLATEFATVDTRPDREKYVAPLDSQAQRNTSMNTWEAMSGDPKEQKKSQAKDRNANSLMSNPMNPLSTEDKPLAAGSEAGPRERNKKSRPKSKRPSSVALNSYEQQSNGIRPYSGARDKPEIDEELSVNPYVLRASISGTCVNELLTAENVSKIKHHFSYRDMSERSKQDVIGNNAGQSCNTFIYHRAEPRMIQAAYSLIASISYFCKKIDSPQDQKRPYHWGSTTKAQVIRQFIDVCNFAATVLANDERCVKLDGSVRIFSDLHGKLDDLRQFERCFFPLGVDAVNSSFLFLGNNLSKGTQAFELIGYLLALKVLFPHKVFLVRGTEELKKMLMEGFVKDVVSKFRDAYRPDVVLSLVKAFDNMPLCAVVNKKMFCSAGGVPHPDTYKDSPFLEQIALYPKLLSDQIDPGTLPHQLLFNEFSNFYPNETLEFDECGFAYSVRKNVFVYTDDAVMRFLTHVGCTHFVRGGRLSQHGISMQCYGRMIAIFSSSHYGNQKNEASCLVINGPKVRVFTVARNAR